MLALPPLTPFTKRLLVVLLGAFVLELVLQNWLGVPVYGWLALDAGRPGLATLWQLFTYPFVWPPAAGAVFPFLLNLLFLWWVVAPYEAMAGRRETVWLGALATWGAGLAGLLTGVLFGVDASLAGTGPLLLGLIAAYAWRLRGRGVVSFFGVLPMRPEHLVWLLLGVSLLFFLASRNVVDLAADVGAVGVGVAYVHFGFGPPRIPRRRRSGPRLVSISGGRRSEPPHWLNREARRSMVRWLRGGDCPSDEGYSVRLG